MRLLLCDDMPEELDKLTVLLNGLGYKPAAFTNGSDVLEHVRSGAAVDVCFLDIVMADMNGVELAEKLREGGFAGEIVFLTASNDFAHQSYQVEAFDYLLKPASPESVGRVLGKIKAARDKADTEGIRLKISGAARFVLFRDIEVVEVIKHNVYFRLSDGSVAEVRAALSEIAPLLLGDSRFKQCHISYVVNMNAIVTVTGRAAVMRSRMMVPISRRYADVKDAVAKRMIGGAGK